MKMYYLLHTKNYRIAFVPLKSWRAQPYNYKIKNWIFSYWTFWPDTSIEIFQFYILGLGFGVKRKTKWR